MKTQDLSFLSKYLDQLLNSEDYKDTSLNGIQVESRKTHVAKVAFAVDAGELVIEQAIKHNADLLIVHHGLLWGSLQKISGAFARKIDLLMKHECSLYASHLPLDGHISLGNGAELARVLGLTQILPAFPYMGTTVGVIADCPTTCTIDDLVLRSRELHGAITPTIIRAGKAQISRVGLVTGAGSFALNEAQQLGLDLLISGEPKQEAFHTAHELKINALFLGHYATETLGVLALKRHIEREFDLETVFIDIPTGI
jgi:dinuclear metal center YbgI/SA1388 family protein